MSLPFSARRWAGTHTRLPRWAAATPDRPTTRLLSRLPRPRSAPLTSIGTEQLPGLPRCESVSRVGTGVGRLCDWSGQRHPGRPGVMSGDGRCRWIGGLGGYVVMAMGSASRDPCRRRMGSGRAGLLLLMPTRRQQSTDVRLHRPGGQLDAQAGRASRGPARQVPNQPLSVPCRRLPRSLPVPRGMDAHRGQPGSAQPRHGMFWFM